MRRTPFALALALALIALLGSAGTAPALSVPDPTSSAPPPLLAAPADEEEDAGEAEASEEEGAEDEECEEDEEGEEECKGEADGDAPPECLLSSVDARIFTSGNRDQVRLQVRYTSASPTTVTLAYGLHGPKGSLFLGNAKKHFGRKGVLRMSRNLTEAQMAKVKAAREFTIRIRALKAPGWCSSFFEHHLKLRRATPGGVSWQRRG